MYIEKLLKLKRLVSFASSALSSEPWYLIFSITGRCNQRCSMCFYWQNIDNADPQKELSLEEIKQIAPHFNHLFQLTLSGGEPLIREDCFEIMCAFADNTPVSRITLPTNGMLTERLCALAERFCAKYPHINLSVNLSLDGIEKEHDEIRGVPGAFDKLLKSFDALGELQKRFSNIERLSVTTVSASNKMRIPALLDFVEKRLDINAHSLLLVRGDIPKEELSAVSVDEFSTLIKNLHGRMKKQSAFSKGFLNAYQKKRIGSLREEKMLDPCNAGKKLLILDEYGNLTPCELLEPLKKQQRLDKPWSEDEDFCLGNLRDANYHFHPLLESDKAKKIRQFIEDSGCHCSFECAMISNFTLNPINLIGITKEALR